MTATHWTLAQTLQRRGITTHALIKVSGLSKGTVYDIVNGKSQGVTLETVDKLLSGLEQLTGQRMTLDAVLDRSEPDDPYAHLFVHTEPFNWEEIQKLIPAWTPEELAADRKLWAEIAAEKQEWRAIAEKRLKQMEEVADSDNKQPDAEPEKSA